MCIVSIFIALIMVSPSKNPVISSTTRHSGFRLLIGRDNKWGSKCNAFLHGCGSCKYLPAVNQTSSKANLKTLHLSQPQPRITWRRNDGSSIVLHNQTGGAIRRVDTVSGSILNLYRVDRRQMGAYLCIAANDVPPAVSKRVFVNVQCKYLRMVGCLSSVWRESRCNLLLFVQIFDRFFDGFCSIEFYSLDFPLSFTIWTFFIFLPNFNCSPSKRNHNE